MDKKYTWNRQELIDNLNILKRKLKEKDLDTEKKESIKDIIDSYNLSLSSCNYFSFGFSLDNIVFSDNLVHYCMNTYEKSYNENPLVFDSKVIDIMKNVSNLKMSDSYYEKKVFNNPEEVVNEARLFLKDLDIEFEELFNHFISKKLIFIKKSKKIDGACSIDDINNKTYIYSTFDGNIYDIYKLMHECFHALQVEKINYKFDNIKTLLTNETIPILSEFLLSNYYNKDDNNTSKTKNANIRRYNYTIEEVKTCLNQLKLYSILNNYKSPDIMLEHFNMKTFNKNFGDCNEIAKKNILKTSYENNVTYAFSYFLAFEFYLQYKENKVEFLKNMNRFITNSCKLELNELCSESGIDFSSIGSDKSKVLLKEFIEKGY